MGQDGFPKTMGQRPGRISEESGTVHNRICGTGCGIPRETLKTVAREIGSAERVCTLMAMGVTQHCVGSDTATAISNLMLVTGNYMHPRTGTYPLRGHNNVQGASDFGSLPAYLP